MDAGQIQYEFWKYFKRILDEWWMKEAGGGHGASVGCLRTCNDRSSVFSIWKPKSGPAVGLASMDVAHLTRRKVMQNTMCQQSFCAAYLFLIQGARTLGRLLAHVAIVWHLCCVLFFFFLTPEATLLCGLVLDAYVVYILYNGECNQKHHFQG